MAYVLTEKLWYTSDRKTAVPDGDPRAAFLLGPAGLEISDAEAERLVLKGTTPPANKKMPAPENKGGFSYEPEVKGNEGVSSGGDEPPGGDELPDDFPAVDLLRGAGLTTFTAVRVTDVTKIKGIGKAMARQIGEALAE